MQIFGYYNYLHECATFYTAGTAQQLRRWLGPEVPNYYVLENGDAVPTTTEIPVSALQNAYLYDMVTQRLTQLGTTEGRHRPAPILGLVIRNPLVGTIDLTDWVGELRMNPVAPINPITLVRLWSAAHNRYIPITDTSLEVTDINGDTSTI
jgi:hypothetical protein